MPKYQINYNRVAPDHRVPFDYDFVKKIQGPLDYMKYWKQGFLTSWFKHYPVHLNGLYIVALFGTIVYFLWDSKADEIFRDKVNKIPALHFTVQLKKGSKAPWDNVLAKYSTDPLGKKDQAFEDI